MNTQTDRQLLQAYTASGSESAFAELVRRHIDLVYSAALRRISDPHLAQDVTQGTFAALAQNARSLANHPVLSGWLHRTTQNIATNLIRTSTRRLAREQEAVTMNQLLSTPPGDTSWHDIAPHLDAALDELDSSDRDAVMLRYFEKKSAREMAAQLGISDDAAQKRVSRAVERLREFFAKRGITVGASGLAVVISANAVQAAPAGFALTISTVAALAGTTLAAAVTVTATKAIAMTTIQKTILASTIAVLAGIGVYEAHQASRLRDQVALLQRQVASLTPRNEVVSPPEPVPVAAPGESAATSLRQDAGSGWAARLQDLNTGDWRKAFSAGQELASLPADTGLAILQTNWGVITNVSARQQLIKAFKFAAHQRLPAVLELGLSDASAEVQSWALNYLKEVALQDFTTDYAAAKTWLASRSHGTLAQAFGDATWQAVNTMRNSTGAPLVAQLGLITEAAELFAKFPHAIVPSGLDQLLAGIAGSSDSSAAVLALKSAGRMPLGEDWYRTAALPLLNTDESRGWAVTAAAARAVAATKSEWALPPMLDALTKRVYAAKNHPSARAFTWDLASALAEHGSPKAIPTMIALIEAENTYDTIYGIGYFGLNKMTGVAYDEKHDGAWWRQWWENNKQRFPADVQASEIPRFEPLARAHSASAE